jgi:hypothetical protein
MAWSVGYAGPIRISTRVEDEREIDIDDRAANLIVELEMLDSAPYALEARNVEITLNFDFSGTDPDPAITIGGVEKGPYQFVKKADNVTLRPGATWSGMITIRTGAFSKTPVTMATPSAVPGRHEIDAQVRFDLAPVRPNGAELIERDATLQLVVARD